MLAPSRHVVRNLNPQNPWSGTSGEEQTKSWLLPTLHRSLVFFPGTPPMGQMSSTQPHSSYGSHEYWSLAISSLAPSPSLSEAPVPSGALTGRQR